MGKLTDSQKRIIVAAYASGGVSLRELAAEYHVSKDTISNILRENKDFQTKLDTIKKKSENQQYKNILEYFKQNDGKLAGRIEKALDVPDEVFDGSSLRDRGGFAKLVAELVLMIKRERENEDGGENSGRRLEVVFVDNSKKTEEVDGE